NTQFAVERVSWEYDLSTTRTVVVTAQAQDAQGLSSLAAYAQIAIAADVTPPETPVVNMNASNPCIATDDKVFAWSVRDSKRVTIHADSFDAESPPVSFQALLSTKPPTNLTSFEANAITWDRTASGKPRGWTAAPPNAFTTNEFVLQYNS